MHYEDFILQVDSEDGRACSVRVDSPAGSGQRTFELPDDLSCGDSCPVDGDNARMLGGRLFETVFSDEVGHLYYGSLARMGESSRLRILIKLQPRSPGFAALASLPWELLYDPRDRFLSLHPQRSIVRHVELQRPEDSEPLNGPLRILVAAARPEQVPDLQWKRELQELQALKQEAEQLDVVLLEPVTPETLHEALLAGTQEGRPFQVLHFVGHGQSRAGRSHLIFEDDRGQPAKVDGESLVEELQGFPSLRLVFLNACRSGQMTGAANAMAGVATALVYGGVPAVIAMQHPISDGASLELSRVFYQRLVSGDPVDAALTEGRLAVRRSRRDGAEWSTPVLFGRTPKGQPFWTPDTVMEMSALRRRAWMAAASLVLVALVFLAFSWRVESHALEATRQNQEGLALLDQGELGGAREKFLSALQTDPDNPAFHSNLGDVESRAGRYTSALDYYRDAARLGPDDGLHAYNLGSMLVFLGHFEEALEPLRRAVDLDSVNAAAWNELATAYRELDRLDEASEAVEKGLDASASFAPLYKNKARIALLRNEPEKALAHLEEAKEHSFGNEDLWDRQEMHLRYAQAYLGSNRRAEGCQSLDELLRLDPVGIGPYAEPADDLNRRHNCFSTEENHA